MGSDVLGLAEVDRTQVGLVGGKGALLGELRSLRGVRVPEGFCVTTDAFSRIMAQAPGIHDRLDRLSGLRPDDQASIGALSAEIRQILEAVAIPDDLAAAITGALAPFGEGVAYAIRSSATAEDLPTASFAGQHDSYLNVVGPAAILDHVSRCWASLFTERAVTYRQQRGFDHRRVRMAVVVQQMVVPQASGVLFTADPVTFNRNVATVEACPGLGEALVAGSVNPDAYRVRHGEILAKDLVREEPALTDAQVVLLEPLGRRIEAHLGAPQDIEWCLDEDGFSVLQSRPITTLFPIPDAGDGEHHVYVSVGHGQMMTAAMTPLGLSLFLLVTPAPMVEAGGRLFVDVTRALASPASRSGLLEIMGRGDPLTRDALETVLARSDFIRSVPDAGPATGAPAANVSKDSVSSDGAPAPLEADPAVVTELIGRTQASIAALQADIRARSGSALVDFIGADIAELRRILFDPQSHQAVMAGMEAAWWLNDRLQAWLGEKNAADGLSRSVPHNVTSEMGLALLDVADVIRPYRAVVEFLELVAASAAGSEDGHDTFLDELVDLDGGAEAAEAIRAYLDRYGMRCVGEIDIARPRWSERPSALVPIILSNVRNFEPGAGPRRFEQGRQEAEQKERELLERLRALPDGARKAEETKRMIDRVRTFSGYREYPKYGMISRYFVYKQALLREAERLVEEQVLREKEDLFFLTFAELGDVVGRHQVDHELVARRRHEFRSAGALTPPRVLTSDGECLGGEYRRRELPAGALPGLAVSGGTVEGRARVIRDMAEADVEPGDVLVTAATDPSWTPLFVTVEGLVTEVGGLMTHGAVIAREYGLPAVVGVKDATRLIGDGQRIRVHGTDGYVEILNDNESGVPPWRVHPL